MIFWNAHLGSHGSLDFRDVRSVHEGWVVGVSRSAPILLSSPDVGELERSYVLRAMESGWIAPAGPDLAAFEREVAGRVGVAHGVALSSGTAALHLSLVSWGVGPGDTVPVSTLTFAATANAVCYVGARPHFVDCDEEGNMSPELLCRALSTLRAEGARVPAVISVDLLGRCVDYDAIEAVTRGSGAKLLCDSAESFGATYRDRAAGAFGDASALSFNGNKIMTTSGGGMLVTDDGDLADHVRKLATQAREPVAHYEHTEVGYNYRLSNLLAALGRAQLVRLDEMMERRRTWRGGYRAALAGLPGVRLLSGDEDGDDNCWLTAIIVDPSVTGWSVEALGTWMSGRGIETRPLWKPMHLQPVFVGAAGTLDGTAERLYHQGLTLPSGSCLTDEQFERVRDALSEWITKWR